MSLLVLNKTKIILFFFDVSSPVYKPKANNGIVKAAASKTHILPARIKPRRILRRRLRNLCGNKR